MKLEYTNQQNAINQLSFNNAHSLFSHTDGLKIIVEDADNKRVSGSVSQHTRNIMHNVVHLK